MPISAQPATPPRSRPPRRRWIVFATVGLIATALLVWSADRLAAGRARAEVARSAAVAAQLHAAVLRSELEKHRSLPFVLAEDAELRAALREADPARRQALSRKLEGLSTRTRAAVIYLLNDQGVGIAASNWSLPTSFVGTDYSFRPYFQNAMRDGVAEYFALGAVSGRPGLFLARRVDAGDGVTGVIVVKVEFESLETEWSSSGEPAFVVDRNGVVLVTNIPAWRFGVAGELTPDRRRRLAALMQMDEAGLRPLSFEGADAENEVRVRLPGSGQERTYIEATTATVSPGWTLHLLEATDPLVPNSVAVARTLTIAACALILFLIGVALYRRQRAEAQEAAREAARHELERRVLERTAELRTSNDRLVVEMDERRRAETNLHLLRDELVQASKLAVLGQVAAGVAHEINQPVAAIRTYADNARMLLERGKPDTARDNLSTIVAMTERVGVITDELRAFSRKSTGVPGPIDLEEPIAGALLLMAPRARRQGVAWVRQGSTRGVRILADRARLEQVLINLFQNALEALEDTPRPTVTIGVDGDADRVRLTVADNGPGAPEGLRSQLFTPFVTSKPNGLGLGLVISRDIVTAFGGELDLVDDPAGARFVIVLQRAPA